MALNEKQKDLIRLAMPVREEAESLIARIDRESAAVADIADPATATAEAVATKLNELMAALRTAELLSE